MQSPVRLTNSLKSLSAALDLLDAAVERRAQADAMRGDLEQEIAVIQEDRARLADDLDRNLENVETLRAANTEVAKRLDLVSATLGQLLANQRESSSPRPD